MIKRVHLVNWKSHKDSSFEFEKGTNVLIGVIGAGKSAIMDGICFALFGSFPALNSKRLSLDEVIMNKPSEMEHAKVEIEFEYNGKNYSVERSIFKGKKSSEAKLFEGKNFIAGPKTSDVTEKIEHILEINYELFSRAVYSEQNQIDFFLRLSPRERKQKFDELLDLEKYERVRGNAVSLDNRIKKTSEDKQRWLKEIQEKFDEKLIAEQEKKLAQKTKQNAELKEKIGKEKNELEALQKELRESEKKAKEFNFLKELRLKLEAKIEEFGEEIKEIEKKIGKKLLDENEKELKEKIVKEKAQEKEIEKGIELEIEEIAVLQSREKEAKKFLLELEKAKSKCPICDGSLGEEKKKELKKSKARELNELNEKMGANKNRRIEWEKKLKLKREELEAMEEAVEGVKKLGQSKEFEKELEKVKKNLNELDYNEKEFVSLSEKIAKKDSVAEAKKREIEQNNELIEELRQSIERINELKIQTVKVKSEIEKLKAMDSKLALFVNALKATQAELREHLIDTVNQAMDDIWQRVYPYQDFVSAKMEIVEGNYELMVKSNEGKWIRVEGILSGGERSAAAICIRIAFALVLTQNLSWLILDEPTHNLDRRAVKELSEMMKNHLPQLVEQIFVITHDIEMEKAASASLYLIERDKNANGISIPSMQAVE